MKQYQPFLLFITKFFGSYIALTLAYKAYLSKFDLQANEIDGITKMVSTQVVRTSRLFNQNVEIIKSNSEAAYKVLFNDQFVARIIEGCNSISVLLLFTSFIIAFSSSWLKTSAYIIIGSFTLYVLNILRIDWFIWALYHYPEQQQLLHDIVFPLLIYGLVLLLWLAWIFKFSKK
ncbi:exosortase family protein XrtF [Flavobacterium sp. HSC-61S13]|uniref:exosortase family protein XrtF n=1 Tax=Flavobacterium sp. HSC-61S13 TaxID=2910963 RepID=UPI00209FFCF0|nr:exosortase family protein XrtF [Flavobacterium sp. HSC-61S13]MCP1994939.1 exosortase family protein XrtF [Flavobacterium sp. HSC-61S13]